MFFSLPTGGIPLDPFQKFAPLAGPLLGPSIFFRLRRAENIARFQEMYVNWNGPLRPLVFQFPSSSKNIFHKKQVLHPKLFKKI